MTKLTQFGLFATALFCLLSPAYAQTVTSKEKKPSFKTLLKDGTAAFEKRDYVAAFDLLKNAAMLKPTHATANYLAGLSAYYRRDYKNASGFLTDVTKCKKYQKTAPKTLYYQGLAFKSLGKYEQAVAALDGYAQYYLMTNGDKKTAEYTDLLAHIKGCTDAINIHASNRYAKASTLGTNVNTPDSEQASVSSKGDLFFTVNTSSLNTVKHLNNETKNVDDIKVSGLRNDQQISNFTFFNDDKNVFLTVKEKNNTQTLKQIYKADFINNEIINLQPLPAKINGAPNSGVSAKDPSFGLNDRQQMVMYFSSNANGSQGGFDLL
jgi:tetratricopeptide (TPR) repeat protein